ncbi:hypothetical protein AVEN_1508-1 [Araneus ventricosus]|uniref:DDE-1 domain-containing protein n=1 Tax=Araneus ventricosus TaxID=182803 RepID=A0A4Y2GGR1_ARAVE|nr:hypothetical protein AVEN_1508-1 [Araneus ventricosus]
MFSDEATFHINSNVNRHNERIWGTSNPHATVEEMDSDSSKVNVFCAMSQDKIFGPFFFRQNTANGIIYLDMLQSWLLPELEEFGGWCTTPLALSFFEVLK